MASLTLVRVFVRVFVRAYSEQRHVSTRVDQKRLSLRIIAPRQHARRSKVVVVAPSVDRWHYHRKWCRYTIRCMHGVVRRSTVRVRADVFVVDAQY